MVPNDNSKVYSNDNMSLLRNERVIPDNAVTLIPTEHRYCTSTTPQLLSKSLQTKFQTIQTSVLVLLLTAVLSIVLQATPSESRSMPMIYGIHCVNKTAVEQYYCNKLLGWCNLLDMWESLTVENLECCYSMDNSTMEENVIAMSLHHRITDCIRNCIGRYKYVQCVDGWVETRYGEWLVSDGMGEVDVVVR